MLGAVMTAWAGNMSVNGKASNDAFKGEGVGRLLDAAGRGDSQQARAIVAGGVDPNAFAAGGVTPLSWALAAGNLRAIKVLLEAGADPNRYDKRTPDEPGVGPALWLAAAAGKKDALLAMLEHGGDPNLRFGNETVLMAAIRERHLDCAELLLQHGGDINLAVGLTTTFDEALLYGYMEPALWVLSHGYTHDLKQARRAIEVEDRRPFQKQLKAKALKIVDERIAAQGK